MNVIYVTVSETLSSVVESQLLLPASLGRATGSVTWLAFTPLGQLIRPQLRRKVVELKRRAEREFGVRLHIVPTAPARYATTRMAQWWARLQMARFLGRATPNIVHARGSLATIMVLEARRHLNAAFRTVFDCRGDAPAENVAESGSDLAAQDLWSVEQRRIYDLALSREAAACDADEIIAVSTKMFHVLTTRHKVPASKVRLQPCNVDLTQFVEPDRDDARRRIGVTSEFVVGYLGSLEWYQLADHMLRVFRLIQTVRSNALFVAITNHPDRMRSALVGAGIHESAFRVLCVHRRDVPGILPALDVGLLLRRSDALNAVACPVKFAEYLASGVPVVITPGVGDCSDIVATETLGACVSLERDDAELLGALAPVLQTTQGEAAALARRCRQYAAEHLSWQSYLRITA